MPRHKCIFLPARPAVIQIKPSTSGNLVSARRRNINLVPTENRWTVRRTGVAPILVKIASAHYDLVFFCRRRESALCLNDGDQDDREKVKHKPLMLQKEAHIGDWLTPAQRMREKLV